ncbi:MAG: 50S ribosomal protein L3 [archaeon]|nr:50S ribosomal protein L3 [archaeon]
MGRKQGPRKGSMQFWPRKRAEKILPRVNWKPFVAKTSNQKPSLLGFIGYKAGMASAFVKDNTNDSMTKGKKIIIPVTIVECPTMKILSVRFYKNKKIAKEVLNEGLDKELQRVIKLPKKKINIKELIEKLEKEVANFDDVHVLVYSESKKAEIKKTPDLVELAIAGNNITEKLNFIKEHLNKEISITDVFPKGLVDIRGLTKGHGFSGAVKRFGIHYRNHKAEKGQKRVGSIGGWHPIGVRFTVPRAGQLGYFTRMVYNSSIVSSKKFTAEDPVSKFTFDHYGNVKTDYLILRGSVQGSQKRPLCITSPLRSDKRQIKKNFELIELR